MLRRWKCLLSAHIHLYVFEIDMTKYPLGYIFLRPNSAYQTHWCLPLHHPTEGLLTNTWFELARNCPGNVLSIMTAFVCKPWPRDWLQIMRSWMERGGWEASMTIAVNRHSFCLTIPPCFSLTRMRWNPFLMTRWRKQTKSTGMINLSKQKIW